MLPWKSLHLLFAVSMVFSIASAFDPCKINNGGCRPGQICVPRQPEIVCVRHPCAPNRICIGRAFSESMKLEPSLPQDIIDPCAYTRCPIGHRCEVYKPTGEAVCYPDCKLNNGGCRPGQICTLRQVQCIKAPCVPIRRCIKFKG